MTYSLAGVIQSRIEDFLAEAGLIGVADPRFLAGKVLERAIYWEKKLEGSKFDRLVLFRFCSPVVMREEVFLGSVLLNCLLSRSTLHACDGDDLSKIAMVGNDIENFYYLWATNATFEQSGKIS